MLPRTETRAQPVLRFVDCVNVEVCDLDLLTYDSIAVRVDGSTEDSCRAVRIHDNRMVARTNVIRATNVAGLSIANNRLHLLDTVDGLATISIQADDVLIERNTLVLLPFVERTRTAAGRRSDPRSIRPCASRDPLRVSGTRAAARFSVWTFLIALPRAEAAVSRDRRHPRARRILERVRILENHLVGGAGNGVTLGGDLDPAEDRNCRQRAAPGGVNDRVSTRLTAALDDRASATRAVPIVNVNVTSNGQFLALVQDEGQRPVRRRRVSRSRCSRHRSQRRARHGQREDRAWLLHAGRVSAISRRAHHRGA